jgi:hypothetical protein
MDALIEGSQHLTVLEELHRGTADCHFVAWVLVHEPADIDA